MKELNVRTESETTRKNARETVQDIGKRNYFLDRTLKPLKAKQKLTNEITSTRKISHARKPINSEKTTFR